MSFYSFPLDDQNFIQKVNQQIHALVRLVDLHSATLGTATHRRICKHCGAWVGTGETLVLLGPATLHPDCFLESFNTEKNPDAPKPCESGT